MSNNYTLLCSLLQRLASLLSCSSCSLSFCLCVSLFWVFFSPWSLCRFRLCAWVCVYVWVCWICSVSGVHGVCGVLQGGQLIDCVYSGHWFSMILCSTTAAASQILLGIHRATHKQGAHTSVSASLGSSTPTQSLFLTLDSVLPPAFLHTVVSCSKLQVVMYYFVQPLKVLTTYYLFIHPKVFCSVTTGKLIWWWWWW